MEDVTKLQAVKVALESENKSLKEVITSLKDNIDTLGNHIQAYRQTLDEVISGNIALKAGCAKLEKQHEQLSNTVNYQTSQLNIKEQELIDLRTKVSELETQSPAKKTKAA